LRPGQALDKSAHLGFLQAEKGWATPDLVLHTWHDHEEDWCISMMA
jgi:hypothetical protein